MRKSTLGVLLSLLLLAWPALAQEQRGSIQGVVKDNSGAVLPGATVEAKSTSGAVAATTTDGNGVYRFPALLIGTYDVTATMQGFAAAKVANVPVRLGDLKTVDLSLGVGGLSEAVQVSAEAPLIDVKQSTKSTSIRAEQIDLLPHNRDFTSLITQAPGANFEAKFSGTTGYTGVSIDGASAAENRYVMDGMETTDIVHGQNGKNLLADFVEEVQIKSSGYEAEYGGSTGGVVNVVTKSGSDLFHGSGTLFWQGDATQASPAPTLRLKLTNTSQSEYQSYPKDQFNRYEPGFTLGGPIMKSKMWFFGGYQPALTRTERIVNSTTSGNPNDTHEFDQVRKDQVQYLTANHTTQLSSKLSTRIAFNNSWSKQEGQLPTLAGTDAATTVYTKGTTFPNWSLSGRADYVASPSLLLSARVGTFRTDQHDFNVNDVVRYVFSGSTNIGLPGVPADLQHPSGYTNVSSNNGVKQDTVSRNFIQADATWYVHGAGEHSIKGGVQIDRRGEDIVSGELKNRVTLNWNKPFNTSSGQAIRGTYGYYSVRSNAVLPQQGLITQGNVNSNLTGLFIQDAWTVNPKLTINVGVRTENENVPAYTTDATNLLGSNPINFSMADKIAPRAGFAYDLKGDGRSKIYGSWGMFYDIFKLELPQGSFGGQKWIEYYYTLDQPDYTALLTGSGCPPACSGTLIASTNFRLPSLNPGDVQNSIKPMRSQEVAVGFEQQLANSMAVGVRFVHKQLDRGIEDTGDIDADDNEVYTIANPGEGLTQTYNLGEFGALYAGSSGQYTLPKPKRNYNAVEFTLEKRLSNSWFFKGSYTVSKLSGNYPGLAESDENGRSDPNVGRMYDYPIEMYDGSGKPIDDVLATDRTHYVKLGATYMFKFGTTVGANQSIASGLPIGPSVGTLGQHGYPLYYLGRDGAGRTPMYSQTDLYVQHEFKVGGNRRVQLSMNVLNLFNQRATIDRFNNTLNGSAISFDEAAFYAGKVNIQQIINSGIADGSLTPDPRFLKDSAFQIPLLARFGVRFMF
jgi:hypothetical protein